MPLLTTESQRSAGAAARAQRPRSSRAGHPHHRLKGAPE
jgi:hypothetical protein